MTEEEKRFKEIIGEMEELYRKKNADYGDSFHQAWRKFGKTVGLVYMDAKLNRIKQLLAHPESQQVHSEKIDDTLIDLANYAVLTIMEDNKLPYDTAIQLITPLSNELQRTFEFSVEQNLSLLDSYVNSVNSFKFVGNQAIALKIQLEQQRKGKFTSSEPVKTGVFKLEDKGKLTRSLPVQIVLEEGGIMPKKATDGSAGYDLFAPENVVIQPGRNLVRLNFRMALPLGIGATVNSRSGFTLKGFEGYSSKEYYDNGGKLKIYEESDGPSRMNADVKWGLIDLDYRGICGVLVYSYEQEPFLLAKGTKFAQMCFQQYEDVSFIPTDKLDDTERKGGFGHTGTR